MNVADLKKQDDFLSDVDNLSTYIRCINCRNRLWKQTIFKRMGDKVASSETIPVGKNTVAFTNKIEHCFFCKEKFFAETKKGSQLYLIEDAKSGITRLI